MANSGVRYDRRVSAAFLSHFLGDGVAELLPQLAKYARYPVDFQFRKDVKSGAEHATLYVGLTAVLTREAGQEGLAEPAHASHPPEERRLRRSVEEAAVGEALAEIWGEVEAYLERIVPWRRCPTVTRKARSRRRCRRTRTRPRRSSTAR